MQQKLMQPRSRRLSPQFPVAASTVAHFRRLGIEILPANAPVADIVKAFRQPTTPTEQPTLFVTQFEAVQYGPSDVRFAVKVRGAAYIERKHLDQTSPECVLPKTATDFAIESEYPLVVKASQPIDMQPQQWLAQFGQKVTALFVAPAMMTEEPEVTAESIDWTGARELEFVGAPN
jgi:hypothetical protein